MKNLLFTTLWKLWSYIHGHKTWDVYDIEQVSEMRRKKNGYGKLNKDGDIILADKSCYTFYKGYEFFNPKKYKIDFIVYERDSFWETDVIGYTYRNRRLDYKIRRLFHLSCKAKFNKHCTKHNIYNGYWQRMCEKYESFIRWLEYKLDY